MKNTYQLEKWIWNQDDFDRLSWNDCYIRAVAFEDDILFDLDYVFYTEFSKVNSAEPKYWLSPVTLIFKSPESFTVDMKMDAINGFRIIYIYKKISNKKLCYHLQGYEGSMMIECEEFDMIVRRPPSLQISTALPDMERGSISFAKLSEKKFQPDDDILKAREASYHLHDVRNQLLATSREFDLFDFDNLNPKDKILKRRAFKKRIEELSILVKNAESELTKLYTSGIS